MRRNQFKLFVVSIIITTLITSCKPDPVPIIDNSTKPVTGWTGGDNPATVPTSLSYTFASPGSAANVDLSQYLGPIGDQGNTGTCVAWATAYYTKTANEAVIFNRTQSQLFSPSYQFSPKYLFYSIPNDKKGANCDGTDFIPALDILQQRGAATMATVPYVNLGNCNSSGILSNWNTEAAQHKIKYYRKIGFNLASLKQELKNKNAVIIGIRVGQNFNNFRGPGILSSSGALLNSYHALTVVGYDDGRNAFRIANSWGTGWGDQGFIWVDYNFFFSGNFVYNQNTYIIATEETAPDPNPPGPTNSGVDLASWVYTDVSTAFQTGQPNSRSINFNVFNIGTQAALPSANWSFYYLYYNAFNANDYGILFHDGFNATVAPNSFFCPNAFTCNFNYAIQPTSNFAQTVFGLQSISRGYFVPPITGYYYLIMVADPGGAFAEQNKQNNIFYTTGQFPKFFQGGFSNRNIGSDSLMFRNDLDPSTTNLKGSRFNTAVNAGTPNAYTPAEVFAFLRYKVKEGDFRKKVEEFNLTPQIHGVGYQNNSH